MATARLLQPSLTLSPIDASTLPAADDSFDFGLVFTVLQHVPEPGVLDASTNSAG